MSASSLLVMNPDGTYSFDTATFSSPGGGGAGVTTITPANSTSVDGNVTFSSPNGTLQISSDSATNINFECSNILYGASGGSVVCDSTGNVNVTSVGGNIVLATSTAGIESIDITAYDNLTYTATTGTINAITNNGNDISLSNGSTGLVVGLDNGSAPNPGVFLSPTEFLYNGTQVQIQVAGLAVIDDVGVADYYFPVPVGSIISQSAVVIALLQVRDGTTQNWIVSATPLLASGVWYIHVVFADNVGSAGTSIAWSVLAPTCTPGTASPIAPT